MMVWLYYSLRSNYSTSLKWFVDKNQLITVIIMCYVTEVSFPRLVRELLR